MGHVRWAATHELAQALHPIHMPVPTVLQPVPRRAPRAAAVCAHRTRRCPATGSKQGISPSSRRRALLLRSQASTAEVRALHGLCKELEGRQRQAAGPAAPASPIQEQQQQQQQGEV